MLPPPLELRDMGKRKRGRPSFIKLELQTVQLGILQEGGEWNFSFHPFGLRLR